MKGCVLGFLIGVLGANAATMNNGGFEELAIEGSYVPFGAGSNIGGGWVVESGTVELVRDYWQNAEGRQSVDLSGIWDQAGTIYQEVSTLPNRAYTIRFALAGNPEGGDAEKYMKVFWNDGEIANLTFDTTGRTMTDMGWTYHTCRVTATSSTSRLKFQSLTFNFLGPVIDDVSIQEEPVVGGIQNGSFEDLAIGVPYQAFYAGQDIGGGWIVESGTVELVRNYWQNAHGAQSVDLSGLFDDIGTLYQDIPTVPGQAYTVRFAFAGNPEDPGTDKRMKVFWNEGEIADLTFNTAGRSLSDMGWGYHSYSVTAKGTTSRLRFQSLTRGFLGPVIDDVSVEPFHAATLDVELIARINVTGSPGEVYRIEYLLQSEHGEEWRELTIVTIPESGRTFALDPDGVRGQKRIYRAALVAGQ